MPPKPIFIMAGGTGGHVYPALAVADYLRGHGVPLYWLGTRQGLESRVLARANYPLLTVSIAGLRGKGVAGWLLAPLRICAAVAQAILFMFRYRPAAVLGMGGFVSGPGGLAAWMLRIPLLIHEQNAIAGLTNRVLAPLARVVMQGFPGTFPRARDAVTTGNPVRAAIAGLPAPGERFAQRKDNGIRLLVLGGSQGARALNRCMPEAAGLLQRDTNVQIWHQTGTAHFEETRGHYVKLGIGEPAVRVMPYIEDMAAAYDWADLVLARAGALTLAELCAAGIAAILVPFPFAVDDHQTANARHLVDAGCAVMLPESELSAERIAGLVHDGFLDRARLLGMAERCRALGRPDASRIVGDICLEYARA